jgi:hypothetical protein
MGANYLRHRGVRGMTALKPCPFGCTFLDVEVVVDPESTMVHRQWWYVVCGCCLCRGPWTSTSKQHAAELWNSRYVEHKEEV